MELHPVALYQLTPDGFNPLEYTVPHDALDFGIVCEQRLECVQVTSIKGIDITSDYGLVVFLDAHWSIQGKVCFLLGDSPRRQCSGARKSK
jgi:hypothetical protein